MLATGHIMDGATTDHAYISCKVKREESTSAEIEMGHLPILHCDICLFYRHLA